MSISVHKQKACLIFIFICLLLFANCNSKDAAGVDVHKVIITVMENDKTTVTYANENVMATSKSMVIENTNDFPIEVAFIQQDGASDAWNDGITSTIDAHKSAAIDNFVENVNYTVGCRADVDKGTEIVLLLKDNSF